MNRILTDEEVAELRATERERLEAENWKAINPLWRLSDPLTVQQAAALIAGFDPNVVRFNSNNGAWFESETGFTDSGGISWVQTVFLSLVNAINDKNLKAKLRHDADPRYTAGMDNLQGRGYWGREDVAEIKDWDGTSYVITPNPNWAKSTVSRSDLVAWLEAAGIRTGFFFPAATDAPDYLDTKNPRYAPKLAAAVRAWQSVTDAGARSPKQALEKWLREHAAEFGLTDDDGNAVNKAMEECSTVANWQRGGGAPKTPGG